MFPTHLNQLFENRNCSEFVQKLIDILKETKVDDSYHTSQSTINGGIYIFILELIT